MPASPHVRIIAALAAVLACASLLLVLAPAKAQDPDLEVQAVVPMLARDGIDWSGPPPTSGDYCGVAPNPQRPPEGAVLGRLTIGGAPAPAGTRVQVFFDGKAGPSVQTTDAGGYRVLFDIGGANCANRVGAAISFEVNGAPVATGRVLVAEPIRYDIALP